MKTATYYMGGHGDVCATKDVYTQVPTSQGKKISDKPHPPITGMNLVTSNDQ